MNHHATRPAASSVASSIADGLSYTTRLSVSWSPLAALPDATTLELHHDDNLRTLAAVALLNEQRGTAVAGEDSNTLEAEVARLHQKLNLLADVMATLVGQIMPGAPAVPAQLSAQGLRWQAAEASGLGLLSLRLHHGVPQPFVWPATCTASHDGWQEARFEPMSEACQAALERHVFMHHRRAVAVQRRPVARDE